MWLSIHSELIWPYQPSLSHRSARAWWISASATWTIQWESWCASPKRRSTFSHCWRHLTWQCGRASLQPSLLWASWSSCSGASRQCAARTIQEGIHRLLSPLRFRVPSGSSTGLSCNKVGDMVWVWPSQRALHKGQHLKIMCLSFCRAKARQVSFHWNHTYVIHMHTS